MTNIRLKLKWHFNQKTITKTKSKFDTGQKAIFLFVYETWFYI